MRQCPAVLAACGVIAAGAGHAHADEPRRQKTLTVVVVGDVGLNRNQVEVDERGIREGGSVLPWDELTVGIRDFLSGDLGFMNLETVVTDRNDLRPGDKRQKSPYLFRSHPRGVEHLADIGFNLISAANNHAFDYGAEGVLETIAHLSSLQKKRKLHFAGIGKDRDAAARPSVLDVRGTRVAFSAIGIVTNNIDAHRAKADRPGTLGYRFDDDWKFSTDKLAEATADLRILSIHYGKERDIRPDARQLDEWRWAVRERDVDVVIGHHAHVVRGIELHHGKLIFYGLGNFLIRGARDMRKEASLRVCCDYGLLARVHLKQLKQSGKYRARAIEVVPIVDMQRVARPWEDITESRRRIDVLNVLAERLDDEAADSFGVRFQARDDGTGLWCAPSAKRDPPPIGPLCKSHRPPGPPSPDVVERVDAAPDPDRESTARPPTGKRAKPPAGKRRPRPRPPARRRP